MVLVEEPKSFRASLKVQPGARKGRLQRLLRRNGKGE
jgi:hypothetical protein